MRTAAWVIIAVAVAAVAALAALPYALASYYHPYAASTAAEPGYGYYGPGMMGGYGYYGATSGYGGTVAIQRAMSAAESILPGSTAVRSNDTVELGANGVVDVTAYAMMPDMAERMTGTAPPAYSSGDVFVIDGEINPTLVIRSTGPVELNLTLVNLDDDMYHNLVVTAEPPPYGYYPMSAMMGQSSMRMVPFLPPANYSTGVAYYYSYGSYLPGPGTYWYLCTYPGHAQEGMYGEILVEP